MFIDIRILNVHYSGYTVGIILQTLYSPFLHYPLVPSFKKINIGNTGNQNHPEGGTWLPVFPILIFVSRKPADNAKTVNKIL